MVGKLVGLLVGLMVGKLVGLLVTVAWVGTDVGAFVVEVQVAGLNDDQRQI